MIDKLIKLLGVFVALALVYWAVLLVSMYNYKAIQMNKPVPKVITVNKHTVLKIEGPILNPVTAAFMAGGKRTDIVALRRALVHKVKSGMDHIYIKINSGGGLLNEGMDFVRTMRAARKSGVQLTCVVDGQAMSMALIIFTECDTRYAVFGSKVMAHSILLSGRGRISLKKAQEIVQYIETNNSIVWYNTRRYFWPVYFNKHFKAETYLDVSEVEQQGFGYLRVIRQFHVE